MKKYRLDFDFEETDGRTPTLSMKSHLNGLDDIQVYTDAWHPGVKLATVQLCNSEKWGVGETKLC